MSSPSSFQTPSSTEPHKNHFSSIRDSKRSKLGSEQKQHSSGSAVRLGDYVRQREFSKEKQIVGQIKSIQLVGDDDPVTKQLKFKKQNVNRLYDKITIQINKKRQELANKSQEELIKEENFMDEVLKMIVGTKPGDLYGKYTSTQTSSVSTAPYNISRKYISNTFEDNDTRFKTESQKPSFKYSSTEKILDDSLTKGNKVTDKIETLLDKYRNKERSQEKVLGRKNEEIKGLSNVDSKLTSSVHNLRMMRPPPIPKK